MNVDWLEPWCPVENARSLEQELTFEINSNYDHPLFGKKAVALARRTDRDDVLFYLTDDKRFAVVHLTWNSESSPDFPGTWFYSSLEDWVEKCMKPDYEDFHYGE